MESLREPNGVVGPPLVFQPVRFRVERFEYAPSELLLRLSLRLSCRPRRTCPMLFIERDGHEHAFTPLVSCVAGTRATGSEEWLWRGAFPVALDLESAPGGSYVLSLREDLLLALPAPTVRPDGDRAQARRAEHNWRPWPYAIRRTALLLLVTCQLGLGPGVSAVSVAGASSGLGSEAEPLSEGEPQPPTGGAEEPGAEAPPEPPAGAPGETPPEAPAPTGEPPQTPPQGPTAPSGGAPSGPGPETPAQSSYAPAASGAAVSENASAPADASSPTPAGFGAPRPKRTSAPTRRLGVYPGAKGTHRHDGRRVGDGRPAGGAPSMSISPKLDPTEALTLPAGLPPGLLGGFEEGPPAYLIPIYEQAADRYHVPWRVLAAINAIETDYGRNLGVSSAGAVGWMQFMPDTWRQWAVDGDRDGQLNPYSPGDAIFTAARYLRASGAARNLRAAIFAYNHADWYVTDVLLRARMLTNLASFARVEQGYSLPLDSRYMREFGRTDDGVDMESAPDGALVYSMTPGVVSAVASDPAGFGPDYPVIEASSGSLAGAHIYYGHVAAALVQPGQPVHAGQPIAIVGHTGDAASLGHGHIEIGFSDAGGDPLSHHGDDAWTPAGAVMRSFLGTLSTSFGVYGSQ